MLAGVVGVAGVAGVAAGIDDPDEETSLDPHEPDNEPTMIRPSPVPVALIARAPSAGRASGRGFAASLRGRVGKYELRDKLARGSFGVVFTARDPNLDRDVAIKVLRPTHLTNQDIVQRFLQEARATARIAHPGIVTIHDCGRVDTGAGETAFIAMELLAGESLTSRLARTGRLAPGAAAEIARQIASALEAAHRVDVLHRDLKPDNIYIVPDPAMPDGERVKVLDFGLAKLGQDGHTQLQTVFGTPRYMSPEQCRSATQIDHRGDIYALGCILFELITGRVPFDGDVRQLIERHQRATPPRARSVVPELSPALDDLIADMLAKDPMQRPQTMGAVQRALRRAGSGAPACDAGPVGPIDPASPIEQFAVGTDASRQPPRPTPARPGDRPRRPTPHPRPSTDRHRPLERAAEHLRPPASRPLPRLSMLPAGLPAGPPDLAPSVEHGMVPGCDDQTVPYDRYSIAGLELPLPAPAVLTPAPAAPAAAREGDATIGAGTLSGELLVPADPDRRRSSTRPAVGRAIWRTRRAWLVILGAALVMCSALIAYLAMV